MTETITEKTRAASIKRGRHGRFDLFVEADDGIQYHRGQFDNALEAMTAARAMGAIADLKDVHG